MRSLWIRIGVAVLGLVIIMGTGLGHSALIALETLPISHEQQTGDEQTIVAEDPAPDPEAADDTVPDTPVADNRPSIGSEVFIAYVYASERVAAWSDYALAISKSAKDAEVLAKFGLVSVDEVKSRQAARQAALDELRLQKLNQEAASGQISAYTGTGSSPAEALSADPELAAQLKLSLLSEKSAARGLQHAQLQLRSGTSSAAEVDAQQLVYLQARLSVIAVKIAYCESILAAYIASGGQAMRLTAFLETLNQQAEIAELEEWQALLDTYMIRPYSRSEAAAHSSIPRSMEQEGERFVPLRAYAEALHYELEWVPEQSRVQLSNGQQTISLTMLETQVLIDNEAYSLLGAPYVRSGHTYVPLTLFSSLLGLEVYWIEQEEQAMILPGIGEVGLP